MNTQCLWLPKKVSWHIREGPERHQQRSLPSQSAELRPNTCSNHLHAHSKQQRQSKQVTYTRQLTQTIQAGTEVCSCERENPLLGEDCNTCWRMLAAHPTCCSHPCHPTKTNIGERAENRGVLLSLGLP